MESLAVHTFPEFKKTRYIKTEWCSRHRAHLKPGVYAISGGWRMEKEGIITFPCNMSITDSEQYNLRLSLCCYRKVTVSRM